MEILGILMNHKDHDMPQQLCNEIENCLIPQTRQLNFIASNTNSPSEEQRAEIIGFIDQLYGQYQRVFSEHQSYIENKTNNSPVFQHCCEQILKVRRFLVAQEKRDYPKVPPISQPLPPPEPIPDPSWMYIAWEKVWEKACEVLHLLFQWLGYVSSMLTPST